MRSGRLCAARALGTFPETAERSLEYCRGLLHNSCVIRKHAVVRGEVQGVGFRYNARAVASRLGVAGYARNLRDGSVEVEIEGDETTVAGMIAWLRSGPTWAIVQSVDVADLEPLGDSEFRVIS